MMTEGLRDRQRRQTHETIREAAYDLAVERGLAAITVADISAAAGVSQRTFFNHFRTKEDALLPDMPDFRPDVVAAFLARAEPDLLTALQTLFTGHLADMTAPGTPRRSPEHLMRLVSTNPELLPATLGIFEAFENQVAGLVARRTGRCDVDTFCRVAALVATGAVRVALLEHRRDTASASPADDVTPVEPAVLAASFAALRTLLAVDAER